MRGDTGLPELPDAHRLVRNAIAMASVIGVPYESVERARDAVLRIENVVDGEQVFGAHEVRALRELLRDVQERLDASLDTNSRPRGNGGELILEEARKPEQLDSGETDFDRVFQLNSDGTVSLMYPRMSLDAFLELLPEAIRFFDQADERAFDVILAE
jgi:hypothetical protein